MYVYGIYVQSVCASGPIVSGMKGFHYIFVVLGSHMPS